MSVLGMEVVTASGEVVYTDATHHADLFWAARGAGPGFFGVVTRYDLRLHPLPAVIGLRSVIFDLGSIDDVSEWIDTISKAAPPQVEIVCVIGANGAHAAAGPVAPTLLVAMFAFADSDLQARAWLAPIDSVPVRAKVVAKMQYTRATLADLQAVNDESFPNGHRFAADHCWSDSAARPVLHAARDAALASPSSLSFLFFSPRVVRTAPKLADAAFSMARPIYFGAYGFWTEPGQDGTNIAWVRSALASLEPLTTGHYVGEADLSVNPQRARRCFSPQAWDRLATLKTKHDPSDVFFSYLVD